MIKPMLLKTCKDSDLTKYEGEWIAQVKFDGTRIIAVKENNNVILQTRSGKSELSSEYPDIIKELQSIPYDFTLDGELVFYDDEIGGRIFLTGKAKESREGLTARLVLFDILEFGGTNYREVCQISRSVWVEELIISYKFKYILCPILHCEHFNSLYKTVVKNGGEGIVLKKKDSIYEDGKRSKYWLKVKRVETYDCFVIGLMKGKGKYSDIFGSVVLGQYENGVIKVVGACSGFDDTTRNQIYDIVMAQPERESFPVTKRRIHHYIKRVAPTLPMEIECMERHANGMMRHPRFLQFRDDKRVEDCSYEP